MGYRRTILAYYRQRAVWLYFIKHLGCLNTWSNQIKLAIIIQHENCSQTVILRLLLFLYLFCQVEKASGLALNPVKEYRFNKPISMSLLSLCKYYNTNKNSMCSTKFSMYWLMLSHVVEGKSIWTYFTYVNISETFRTCCA